MQDRIERIKEWLVVVDRFDVRFALFMEVEGIEGADGDAIQREGGRVEGEDQFGLGRWLELAGNFGVVAKHEDAAHEVLAGGDAVQPAHGVFDCWYCCLSSRNSSMPWNWMPS